nr:hypothetical protein Ade03nite_29650 [Actinoplanes derwentensis]
MGDSKREKVEEQPPPLSYPESGTSERLATAVLLPERFRGGFAPSAPCAQGLSRMGITGRTNLPAHTPMIGSPRVCL